MTPELHIQRFLSEAKERTRPALFRYIERGLIYYLEFLRDQNKSSVEVHPDFINRFREYLYHTRAYDRTTAWIYVKGVKTFYEYLVLRSLLKENPVKPYTFKKVLYRNRYYTNLEIKRAYLANLRSAVRRPSSLLGFIKLWKTRESLLAQNHLHLQTLDRSGIEIFCQALDHYQTKKGRPLSRDSRQRSLEFLIKVLRWMDHNGYRKDNPTKNFQYPWTDHQAIPEREEEPLDRIWQGTQVKYLEEGQILWRKGTIVTRKYHLKKFCHYLSEQKILEPTRISLKVLENYRAKVWSQEHLGASTKSSHLLTIKSFMNYLEKTDQILINPIHKMSFPKKVNGLPTRLMSSHDVAMLMNVPDIRTPVGLRNRSLFELMYSTGARIGEATSVRIEDIDFENGLLRINNPKGGPEYQRVVPIGEIALEWIKRYIKEARDQFPAQAVPNLKNNYSKGTAQKGNERMLFLTKAGKPMNWVTADSAMRAYALKAGMRKIYSTHSWRVTCATTMLRNGADIRYVQEQLGHRSLNSTKIYTRLFPMDLKKVHQKTHPREREYRNLAPNHAGPTSVRVEAGREEVSKI